MIFISFVNKYTKTDRRKIFLAKIVEVKIFLHLLRFESISKMRVMELKLQPIPPINFGVSIDK